MSKSLYKALGCSSTPANIITDNGCCGSSGSQQVNADWNSESGPSKILNKPPLPLALKLLVTDEDVQSLAAPTNFDGYTAPGSTLHHDKLVGKKLLFASVDGITVYDFGDNPVTLTSGTIDFTSIGGLTAGGRVVIIYA